MIETTEVASTLLEWLDAVCFSPRLFHLEFTDCRLAAYRCTLPPDELIFNFNNSKLYDQSTVYTNVTERGQSTDKRDEG